MINFDIIRKGIELPSVMELNWTKPESCMFHDDRCGCLWCNVHRDHYRVFGIGLREVLKEEACQKEMDEHTLNLANQKATLLRRFSELVRELQAD